MILPISSWWSTSRRILSKNSVNMMDISKCLFFLSFVFLVVHIKGEDIHFVLTQENIPRHSYYRDRNDEYKVEVDPDQWLVSDFLPQANKNLNCSESNWEQQSQAVSSSILSDVSKKWTLGTVESLANLIFAFEKTWNKYGGCITDFEEVKDVNKYFSKSFELYDKYNMNKILRQGNITSGKSYSYQEISDAVSQGLQGKKAILKCEWNYYKNIMLLTHIKIFLDNSMRIIDPPKNYYYGKCPSDLPIFYSSAETKSFILAPTMIYDNPFEKYPTIKEDDNGYYYLLQSHLPAVYNFNNYRTCKKSKYLWINQKFTYFFTNNVEFTCSGDSNNPHNLDKINITTLSSIRKEVVDKWGIQKDLSYTNEDEVLTRYWHQQAECSAYFKGLDTAFKFYKKSLDLFDRFNMDTILRRSNIVPGKNYTYQEISDAVLKGTNNIPAVIFCKPFDNDNNFGILSDIGFFMDKCFKPIEVEKNDDGSLESIYGCKHKKLIYYQDFEYYVNKERERQERKPVTIA